MTEIIIKSVNLRGCWNLETINDECPICRNSVLETCVECSGTSGECVSVMGVCEHIYHLHCIEKWTKTKNSCPLDNKKWEYKKPDICQVIGGKKYTPNQPAGLPEFPGLPAPSGLLAPGLPAPGGLPEFPGLPAPGGLPATGLTGPTGPDGLINSINLAGLNGPVGPFIIGWNHNQNTNFNVFDINNIVNPENSNLVGPGAENSDDEEEDSENSDEENSDSENSDEENSEADEETPIDE